MGTFPPAASALGINELKEALILIGQRSDCPALFRSALRKYVGVKYVFFTSSGRAALTVLLQALNRLRGRDEVIVPGYCCFSVPSAIARAGLKIRPVDIDPHTLDYDYDALKRSINPDTLAVIGIHQYGMPCRIAALENLCAEKGVPLIDDAAQALGGIVGNRKLGSFGDAGILSFGRGKPMTTVGGGAIITSSETVAEAVGRVYASIDSGGSRLHHAVLAAAYPVTVRPSVFAFVKKLPFIEVGVTRFSTDFIQQRMSAMQAALGTACLQRLDEENAIRKRNALRLISNMQDIHGIKLLQPADENDEGVYLRLPVVFESASTAETTNSKLVRLGLGVGRSYPGCITDIPDALSHISCDPGPLPGAKYVVQRLLTLPTHHLMNVKAYDAMIRSIIGECETVGRSNVKHSVQGIREVKDA